MYHIKKIKFYMCIQINKDHSITDSNHSLNIITWIHINKDHSTTDSYHSLNIITWIQKIHRTAARNDFLTCLANNNDMRYESSL